MPTQLPRHCHPRGRSRRLLRLTLLAGFALFGTPALAPAEAQALSPLVSPPTSDHHVGKPIFVQLVTPDLDTAKRFYGDLFGWSFRPAQAGATDAVMAYADDQPIAGLIHREFPAGTQRQPAWLTFLSVRDVDATNTLAMQGGARVLVSPRNIPGLGREAIYADPQGAVFATLASASGDPQDVLAAPGQWIWSSLLTTNPDTDAAFYQSLFDYEVFDLPDDAGGPHFMLASDEYARASANRLPPGPEKRHPHWLNYIRVVDTDATVAKLTALGGHVLVPPRPDRHGGRIAVAADPSGAPFGLMEWTDADSKEVLK
jgi:predicted enzyme related to lactoylglutathione lyase